MNNTTNRTSLGEAMATVFSEFLNDDGPIDTDKQYSAPIREKRTITVQVTEDALSYLWALLLTEYENKHYEDDADEESDDSALQALRNLYDNLTVQFHKKSEAA